MEGPGIDKLNLLGVEALLSGGVIKMPMAGIHQVQLWEVFFELDSTCIFVGFPSKEDFPIELLAAENQPKKRWIFC